VLGRAEPDPEIQELILASGGQNVGIDFLPGSLAYTPSGPVQPDADRAADVVRAGAAAVRGAVVVGASGHGDAVGGP
jgi:hypothetical protein